MIYREFCKNLKYFKGFSVVTRYNCFVLLLIMTHALIDAALASTETTAPKLIVLLFSNLSTLEYLELAGFYLPSLIGVLFFISFYSTAHEVSVILLSLGLIVNNLINSGLVAFLNVLRPAPFLEPGQPSREIQTMFFFVSFYAVYAYFWSSGRRWKGPFTLFVAILWSATVYILKQYYTWSQVLGGAFVGAAFGFSFANWARLTVIPHVGSYVTRWNRWIGSCWWSFGCFQLVLVYRRQPCSPYEKNHPRGQQEYIIVPVDANTSTVDFGIELFFHTLIKIIIYALIHFHT